MKRNLIVLFLVALLAGVAAYFAARLITFRDGSIQQRDMLHKREYLAKALRLSDDQQQKLAVLETALGGRVSESCSRNCDARRRLAAALAAETPDPEQLDGILMDMCRSYESSERSVLEHIQALRGILDDGQRKTFDAMMGLCLCGQCGADCHAGPSP